MYKKCGLAQLEEENKLKLINASKIEVHEKNGVIRRTIALYKETVKHQIDSRLISAKQSAAILIARHRFRAERRSLLL
jgi:hypothetical protein